MKTLRTLVTTRMLRAPIVLVATLAWLAVSNHCALGAIAGPIKARSMQSCHGMSAEHAPAKHENENGVECCKVLRATLSVSNKLVSYDAFEFALQPYFTKPMPFREPVQSTLALELDTGPPAGSFAETVLQRSILAHAPPYLA